MRRKVAARTATDLFRAAARDLQRHGQLDRKARSDPEADARRECDGRAAAPAAVLHVHHYARRCRTPAVNAREVLTT